MLETFLSSGFTEKHNFCITGSEVLIDQNTQRQLEEVSSLLPLYINGSRKIVGLSMLDTKEVRASELFRGIRRCLELEGQYGRGIEIARESGNLGLTQEEAVLAGDAIINHDFSQQHPFIRADLIRGLDGHFRVAEVEVGKMHGFGYTTLANDIGSGKKMKPGLVEIFKNFSGEDLTGIILSGHEEFYDVELSYFAKQVNKEGGNLVIVPQSHMVIREDGLYFQGRKVQQITIIPHLQEMSRGELLPGSKMEEELDNLRNSGHLKIIAERNTILERKGMLGIISNRQKDIKLEGLLLSIFSESELLSLRNLIPPTETLGLSRRHNLIKEELRVKSDSYFVKNVSTSGGKGIAKPGDLEGQLMLLSQKPNAVVLQEFVPSETVDLEYVDVLGGDKGEGKFALRYSLFSNSSGKTVDLGITASSGIVAHGGTKSVAVSYKLDI